ncbi:MAG: ThiF family protein [Mycobacterium sp.]|nr:ThiF family protein [Mycobacterium sp.]
MSTDYSRPLKLASHSAEDIVGLEDRLNHTIVVVNCVDRTFLSTMSVLICNLRRLPIDLYIGSESWGALTAADLDTLITRAADIDPERPLRIGEPLNPATLRLHVGPTSRFVDISAVPDGHGVRLRRDGRAFPSHLATGSGLGSVLTAAVLTAEAFKQIVGVQANRQRRHDSFDFNPVTLRVDGPDLPFEVGERIALIGAGAIGTAIGLIFRESCAEGALTVVDSENFDEPNVATYSLGRRQDATRHLHKTQLLKRELPRMDICPVAGTAQEYINRLDQGDLPMPLTVLGAVDSIEARHQIAKIYAPLTLDGSTGGVTGTAIGLAEATSSGPCLRCYFPKLPPDTAPSAEQRLSEQTGLGINLLADGGHVLSTADLERLPAHGQRMLTPHVGKSVCGLARTLGLTGVEDSYRPSAAFVSQQAAALVVGAMIARANRMVGRLRDLEYDTLVGPDHTMIDHRLPNQSCSCQVDSAIIERVREHRRAYALRNRAPGA